MKLVMKPTITERIEKELRRAEERGQLKRIQHIELSSSEWRQLLEEVSWYGGPTYRIAYAPLSSFRYRGFPVSVNDPMEPCDFVSYTFDVVPEGYYP